MRRIYPVDRRRIYSRNRAETPEQWRHGKDAAEVTMDQATIAYWLTWVGTGAWVICFWWMHRISARQDALLTELRELAQTQHDILREVHPDVGEIKEYVVTEQGEKIDAIAQQVTQVADRVIAPEAVSGQENATGTAAGKP
jgi:HxlR-like helix-turn-helix